MRTGFTKGDPCDGVIKLSNAGCILDHLEVIFGLQALEQVRMALEDVAQGFCQVHIVDSVEAYMEVIIRDCLQHSAHTKCH